MSGSLPDFSPGEKLAAAKLDQAMAAIQDAMDATAGISSTLGKQIADNTSGLATVANTVTGSLSQQVASLQQSINNMTTSYGAMQASMASVLSRLSVLEKATPPPATPGAPTGLRATAIGTSSIAMALTAPVGGVAPDNYQWQIATPRGSANWTNGALTGTTTTFSGLTSGTTGTPYDIRAISMSTSAGPGGTSAVYQTATAANPGVVTVPSAPTIISAAASAPNSVTLVLTPGATGSPATSFQWDYRPTAGNILWGSVGHRDQGGPYANISVAQQATDLKAVFGTGTVIYRADGDTSTPAQIGADVLLWQAQGIDPLIVCIPTPAWGTFTTQADAFNAGNSLVGAIVAASPTAKYFEIGNEWTLDATVGAHTGDGSLPAHWSGQPYFLRMVGFTAGAVAAIRAGNPTAKILGGATSGWTLLGLPVAMAQSLANYGGVDRTWDCTVLHWYNDVVGANQMGMPSSFNSGMNAYALLKAAGKPLFITEFGSSDGNIGTNDTNCGTHLAALMDNFLAHQATTATEPGIAGALIYEMYQQPNIPQTDYFLFNYTSGATGAIAPQGTAVRNWITAHPSAFIPGPISSGATLTTTTITGLISSWPYDFRAEGVNSAGVSAASATYNVTTSAGSTASPDGTVIPPSPSIIMNDGSSITLVGGVVQRGGSPLYFTAGVDKVGVFNGGKLYQENTATPPGVWHLDETAPGGWVADTVNPFVIAVTPPPVTVTTVSTPSTATIATTDGHVLSLTPGTGNGGEVMRDGIAMAGGGGTSTIAYNSATNAIYAQDAGGSGWYLWNGSTWINSPDPTGGAIITPPVPIVTTGVFTVTAAGGFVDPTNKPWSMRGLNGGPQDLVTGFAGCFTQFPGTTAVRLNCNSNNNEDALIRQAVSLYTGRGCVVEVEDHWSGNNGNTGWYTTYATLFKSNPYVFMETPNEPNGGSSPQIAVINAIRAAGFTGPIGLQPQGGYDYSSIQAVINAVGRTNIFVTPHLYIGGNTDPNAPLANLNSNIATSLGFGLFPCIDEFGEGVDGFTLDQYGTVNTSVIIAANVAGKCGAVYWAMNNGNHSNGVDSAFLNPQGTALTPTGSGPLKSWLAGAAQVQGTVFYDNFVGTSIDTTKWRRGYFWQPGGGGGAGGWEIWEGAPSALNVYVVGSNTVQCQVRPTPAGFASQVGNNPWIVPNLNSYGKFQRTFGYWEVTARLIKNKGCLSAIWLYTASDASNPAMEIDITETASSRPTTMHMTTHTTQVANPQDKTTADESAGFHRYGLNWTDSVIEWYFDRVLVASGTTPANIKGDCYLLLSAYVNSDGSAWWGGDRVSTADTWGGTDGSMTVSEVAVWAAKPF